MELSNQDPGAAACPDARRAGDDSDLLAVQRTLRGEREAFAGIVRKYTPLLYSLSLQMLGSREEAEEAVQEILLRAYRGLGRFKLSMRLHPWLYTIALNWLRTQRRRNWRRRLFRTTAHPEALAAARAAAGDSPHDAAERREGERIARGALDRLPAKYREAFVLREIEGLSVREAAEALGLPEATVKTHAHRARLRLAAIIAEQGWAPPRAGGETDGARAGI